MPRAEVPTGLRLLVALPSPGLLLSPDGRLLAVSDAWRGLLAQVGVPEQDRAAWLPGGDLLAALGRLGGGVTDHAHVALFEGVLAGPDTVLPQEVVLPFPAGRRCFLLTSSRPAPGERLVVLADITDLRAAEVRLVHQASHDALTGLPNRNVLVERLRMLAAAPRGPHHRRTAVLFLDLDDFKAVNDTLGHAAGDVVLKEVARRLRGVTRDRDLVARLGGDEFVVVAGVSGELEALAYADRLQAALAPVVVVAGQPVLAQASIGVALAAGDGDGSEHLLRDADIAMLRAKADHSGQRLFNDVLDSARRRRADAVEALRAALGRGEVQSWFQPVVRLEDGRPVSAEALARWVRADGSVVPPSAFVPLAEQTGLVGPLDRAVMRAAVEAVAAGALAALPGFSVNASPLQIATGLIVEEVETLLSESGLLPSRLTVEVTETAVLGDPRAARALLGELKHLGVRLALDDFGTGYSSLSHLAELPMDVVKLDRSFVQQVSRDARAREISRAVISMGHALGMSVIAEGVESERQRRALVDLDCRLAQGYLFGVAVPPERFAALHLAPQADGATARPEGAARAGR